MNWIRGYTATCVRLIFVNLLFITLIGCTTNTGPYRSAEAAPTSTGLETPGYVRNLPKSPTGNMPEYTVLGKTYRVLDSAANFTEHGTASWYGKKFHGRKTSSGEVYDMHAMTAAHKHLPLPTFVRVWNKENNRFVVVKVNDRGPFIGNRIIDLSYAAALELGITEQGTAEVYIEALSTHLVAQNDNQPDMPVDNALGQASDVGNPASALTTSTAAVQPIANDVQPSFEDVQPSFENDAATMKTLVLPVDNTGEDDFEQAGIEIAAIADNARLIEQPIDMQIPEVQIMDGADQPFEETESAQSTGRYILQLGAFGRKANAQLLVADVIKKVGLSAFVEKDPTRELYRVKMGPLDKGAVLDAAVTDLASIGIESFKKPAVVR